MASLSRFISLSRHCASAEIDIDSGQQSIGVPSVPLSAVLSCAATSGGSNNLCKRIQICNRSIEHQMRLAKSETYLSSFHRKVGSGFDGPCLQRLIAYRIRSATKPFSALRLLNLSESNIGLTHA